MKKTMFLMMAGLISFQVSALEPLSDSDLQSVEGQAGADLSLKLSLNHDQNFKFDTAGACKNLAYCHLAISPNKRFVKADPNNPGQFIADSESGKKLWLVFKGIQGTIDIQKMSLDGKDLLIADKSSTATAMIYKIKPAMQFGFDPEKAILIRNFGFNALEIEQDNFDSGMVNASGVVDPVAANNIYVKEDATASTPATDYGYLKATTYSGANAYDNGREKGFGGVMMNGNLVLQGKVMMFSCDGSHPRC